MKRRDFFASMLAVGAAAPAMAEAAQHHDHRPINGPLANATVSFGQWQSDPPHDRHPNVSDRTRNGHQLIPHTSFIKAGGTVNFIIAGAHQVIVYGPGTKPGDIVLPPPTMPPAPPALIDDSNNRVYRGLNPFALMPVQDRVEVVHFPKPGLHLVICGLLPHFQDDDMFGWVWVLR